MELTNEILDMLEEMRQQDIERQKTRFNLVVSSRAYEKLQELETQIQLDKKRNISDEFRSQNIV